MYLPRQFLQADQALTLEVMRAYGFATLVSDDDQGQPFATHLPLRAFERDRRVVLAGHVARGNPHAGYLERRPEVLAMFLGPHAYMSPRVYPDLARVPTWNYIAVHAYGTVRVLDGEAAKDALLKSLIALHEPEYAAQWRALEPDFQSKMLSAICAFEVTVERLESKFKLNQHRKEAHEAMKAAYDQGNAHERALAGWMRRLGL